MPDGQLPQGAVAITFDDNAVHNWCRYLRLFDSLHIRATFYISGYKTLNRQQVQKLHELEDRGHEIAYHTSTHPNMVTARIRKGMTQLVADEITAGLEAMRKDGFQPVNFAYPYGRRDEVLDNELLRHFRSVRALNGTGNLNRSFVAAKGSGQVINALEIDAPAKIDDGDIENMVKAAAENRTCLVLVCHEIDNPHYPLHVTVKRLKSIARAVKTYGVRFITMRELAE